MGLRLRESLTILSAVTNPKNTNAQVVLTFQLNARQLEFGNARNVDISLHLTLTRWINGNI